MGTYLDQKYDTPGVNNNHDSSSMISSYFVLSANNIIETPDTSLRFLFQSEQVGCVASLNIHIAARQMGGGIISYPAAANNSLSVFVRSDSASSSVYVYSWCCLAWLG